MTARVLVVDETVGGKRANELTLDFLDERVTVRELIRARVYQEVSEYNARRDGYFRGLVEPSDAERLLNGVRLKEQRRIDWEAQFERALEAFQRNGFILIVNDRQLTELDEVIDLPHDATITFLKLMPLVGG